MNQFGNSNPGNSNSPFADSTHLPVAAQATESARADFIRLVYVLFLAGVVTSIVGGIISLHTPIAGAIMAFSPWSLLLLLPLSIGAQVLADRPQWGNVALFGFTFLMGLIIAPVVALYSAGVVTQAGVLAAVIFSALTAYVFITRKDFNFLGGLLFVGFISLIAAGLLNFFLFQNAGFGYWLSWGILLFSSGFVLYDTSNIMQRYPLNQPAGAALGLFISFYNIFLSLLNILNGDD